MNKLKALLLSAFLSASTFGYSQIKLPRLISDGMVLQRDAKTKVWGWAAPQEKVTLAFNKKTYSATADKDGKWQITLPAQPAGGPFEMKFVASNNITVKDILFGDVWLCSGQSNMELTMARVKDRYANVVTKANNPNIRQFEVPDQFEFKQPKEDLSGGQWIKADQENILKFSAVGYFFATELYDKYKVPMGLINSALGGSPAEAWISEEALISFPTHYAEAQRFKDSSVISQIEAADRKANQEWHAQLNRTDEGLKGQWKNPALNDASWKQMNVPGYWADTELGRVNGSVWFRKEVELPRTAAGSPARLLLGRIVDADSVFINGVFVGTTSYQYPPRIYNVPASVLKEGKNVISVRVINQSGRGGFVTDKPYKLVLGQDSLDLTGPWKYKLGATMAPLSGQPPVRWKPTGLFNAMIAPLTNYTFKGVLWYQGESNTGNPTEYGRLMPTLIQDWRAKWNQANLPFILVQLANFMETTKTPVESNWAATRQAQLNTLSVPNTALAVAIDLGEWNDIHPLNKQDVGKRLALQAMRVAYGDKKVVASGPMLQSVKKDGNKLVLTFSDTGSGLMALGNKDLQYFAIAGPDKKFVWANAVIKGNTVEVWNEEIKNPVTVRYAWADNPEGANLYNKEKLPASPFEASVEVK
ncbi:sialate O-acetylesterase [Sabulibacter ruber]|uniref:sialate O-acetylesterase n=1 Tax=Sabulibacter ruber TaxID=2811901 RepID=UPI001A959E67|nr:sialate O-acetylesterase [Sabulibacter ruber]